MPSDPAIPEVAVTISPDGLSATLRIPPDLPAAASTADALVEAIKQRGIMMNSPRRERIQEIAATIKPLREEPIEAVIAEGRAAIPGEDGRFELDPALEPIEQPEQEEPAQVEGEEVDYYAQSKFLIVLAQQRIGRIFPPTPAEDGEDVGGKVLTAKPGKQCSLRTDSSIKVEGDGTLFAAASGLLQRMGDSMRIEEELQINGFVDFSTGNIDFPGPVSVNKGVRDRFVIRSDGSLEVRELVEAATLESSLDITLNRGAAGRGKGKVIAGRDLHSRYLDAVEVHAGRDACVSNEINECDVHVGRSLEGARCTIVGGSIVVGKTCEVEQFGGEGGITTEVVIGRHDAIERCAATAIALAEEIESQRSRLNVKLKQLQRNTDDSSSEMASELAKAQQDLMLLDAKVRSIQSTLVSTARTFDDDDNVWLLVHKDIFQGARVFLGKFRADFKQDVKGPVKVYVGPKGVPQISEIDTNSTVPLATVAKVVHDDRYVQWSRFLDPSAEAADQAA